MTDDEVVEGQIDSTALVVHGEIVPDQIMVRREPQIVLAEASRAAAALKQVIASKPKKVMFGGEQYIEFEDWQTIARFYGLSVEVTETRFCQFGDAQGFEAFARVINANGDQVTRADAMCLNDEENWGTRTKYAYAYVLKNGSHSVEDPPRDQIVWEDNPNKPGGKRPKKERVIAGQEKVPLFQLRSMAQTRACAKALRNVLAFVPVLAGYRPTPAEELQHAQIEDADIVSAVVAGSTAVSQTSGTTNGSGQTQSQPAQSSASQTAPASQGGDQRRITDKQVKRLWAIAHDLALNEDEVADKLASKFKVESSNDILVRDYDAIIEWIRAKMPA